MDAENDEDASMMAMMGIGGFESTKVHPLALPFAPSSVCSKLRLITQQGKPVTGNQDGAVDVKKPRTWRQYMNRCVYSPNPRVITTPPSPIQLLLTRTFPLSYSRGGFNRFEVLLLSSSINLPCS